MSCLFSAQTNQKKLPKLLIYIHPRSQGPHPVVWAPRFLLSNPNTREENGKKREGQEKKEGSPSSPNTDLVTIRQAMGLTAINTVCVPC